jgi:hypothetical protein
MNPILVKLAKISPKTYAKQILGRNSELLKKLMLLKPYVGNGKEIPDDIAKKVIMESNYGCPHCDPRGCTEVCLWRKVSDDMFSECFHIHFSYGKRKGITLREVVRLKSICVKYWDTSEEIELHSEHISREDFNKCVDFVKAHIEWAKLPIWGSEYKKEYDVEKVQTVIK